MIFAHIVKGGFCPPSWQTLPGCYGAADAYNAAAQSSGLQILDWSKGGVSPPWRSAISMQPIKNDEGTPNLRAAPPLTAPPTPLTQPNTRHAAAQHALHQPCPMLGAGLALPFSALRYAQQQPHVSLVGPNMLKLSPALMSRSCDSLPSLAEAHRRNPVTGEGVADLRQRGDFKYQSASMANLQGGSTSSRGSMTGPCTPNPTGSRAPPRSTPQRLPPRQRLCPREACLRCRTRPKAAPASPAGRRESYPPARGAAEGCRGAPWPTSSRAALACNVVLEGGKGRNETLRF